MIIKPSDSIEYMKVKRDSETYSELEEGKRHLVTLLNSLVEEKNDLELHLVHVNREIRELEKDIGAYLRRLGLAT